MKIRLNFVSNSSSSSFIVINDNGKYKHSMCIAGKDDVLMLPTQFGCTEFGWQVQKYNDVCSKLNWAALMVLSQRDIEKHETSEQTLKAEVNMSWRRAKCMEKMLRDVCKSCLGVKVKLRKAEWRKDQYAVGYIDHQSGIIESPANARMFMSEKALYDFICNDASYVRNSNDSSGNDADMTYDEKSDDYYVVQPKDYER